MEVNKDENGIKKKKKPTNGVTVIQQSHCWAYMQKNSNSKKYMQPNVHRSTTYNNQMDKEDVVYVCVCMYIYPVLCLVTQSFPTLCDTIHCGNPCSSVHGNSPGKNTGVGCHALLQGIFPTQGSNPGLPHCRWIL